MPELEKTILKAIEHELAATVNSGTDGIYSGLGEIFHYQMGWETAAKGTTGKRVRPLLLLLTVNAFGKDWNKALPAAASLELVHNYSLIHDDIEDDSSLRRGKDTVWVKWGRAQGINTGDAMLNLALATPWGLSKDYSVKMVAEVFKSLQHWSLELTKGQYLDISFENRDDVSVEDYFEMVEGKTCSLLKAALEMGGILAETDPENIMTLNKCGSLFGRAYQVQDDWLGIWGETAEIGKSNLSDLLERKKSFPILMGLQNKGEFYKLWNGGRFEDTNIFALVASLADEGIKERCENKYLSLFEQTIDAFGSLKCDKANLTHLTNFVESLLMRKF